MNLNVGSLIYIFSTSPPRLIPCKIVEQIVSRKTEGESVTHIISASPGKNYKLEDLKTPWFPSIDAAKTYLSGQANKMVEETISKAMQEASSNFPNASLELQSNQSPVAQSADVPPQDAIDFSDIDNIENMTIVLENGETARVKLSESLK